MEEKKAKKSGFFSLLSDSIQLRFYRKENFEQIGSINLSPRSIYIALSSTILVLLLLVFVLLAYTPLQRLIPRLSSIENATKFVELSDNLDQIDAQIDAQATYNSALRKMLTGDENVDFSNVDIIGMNSSPIEPQKSTETEAANLIAAEEAHEKRLELETGSIFDDMAAVDFYAPISGIISADFDPQLEHFGVDIIAPSDTPVKSIRDGHIIISEWNIETGHTLGVQHDNNILSFYKHNSALLKEKGDFVKGGEIIAIIGNSGRLTSGPHLHFEIWHNGKPVNPNDYINLKNE
ncbi:MAG: M23 family metallopeptidase [Saprospiraceae bacterium]|nr:M23 family metallopeptidase [Saprospiraceae bacterium]